MELIKQKAFVQELNFHKICSLKKTGVSKRKILCLEQS